MTTRNVVRWLAWLWVAAAWPGPALAHKASDSYLTLQVQGIAVQGHWDIALRDIDFALSLDADGNGEITWGELRARENDLAAWVLQHLTLERGGACALRSSSLLVDHHIDGAYAVLNLDGQCAQSTGPLRLDYRLLFDLDSTHRGLLNLTLDTRVQTAVFAPGSAQQTFAATPPSLWAQLRQYSAEGVWHIWTGFDHLLFLFSLLLPAVLLRVANRWTAATSRRAVFGHVLAVVSAFTLAHSLTLSAAVLGWVTLPSRWVESTVALSVVLAAANNVWPVVGRRLWLFAFCFGLIHGFGFASVLIDLQLPAEALALSLIGFNLGVEAGQLVCVAAFLPLAYALRSTRFYLRWFLPVGSWLTMAVAALWLAERALDLKLITQ
jgi:hypothetical protein